jgi:hypothetical protein
MGSHVYYSLGKILPLPDESTQSAVHVIPHSLVVGRVHIMTIEIPTIIDCYPQYSWLILEGCDAQSDVMVILLCAPRAPPSPR